LSHSSTTQHSFNSKFFENGRAQFWYKHSTYRHNQLKYQDNIKVSCFIIILMHLELLIECVYTVFMQKLPGKTLS